MPRQALSELPLSLFLPTLFPQPQAPVDPSNPHTPHPGAYISKVPPSPVHHPSHLHIHGLKRPHEDTSPRMVAKRRHLEDTIAREEEVNGIAKRLFTDLTPRKESTRVETPKKPKKVAHIPPPESTSRPMPPPSTPGRTAPPKTPAASLSMPSSTSSNPLLTPSEDNKENLPPRRRRTHPSLPLSAGKTITPSTPKVYSAPHLGRSNGNGKEVVPRFAHKLSGKPSTPREIGREMLMEEVDEPEEVDDVF